MGLDVGMLLVCQLSISLLCLQAAKGAQANHTMQGGRTRAQSRCNNGRTLDLVLQDLDECHTRCRSRRM